MTTIDPDVLLLGDAPIASAADDLLGHVPLATRLAELACAGPIGASRTIGVIGGPGSGRSSLLALTRVELGHHLEVVSAAFDASEHDDGTAGLLRAVFDHLTESLAQAGALEKSSQVRDKLAGYLGAVSGVAKLAGVNVDPNALRRSSAAVRAELLQALQAVGRRFVVTIDHADWLGGDHQHQLLRALHQSMAIPFVTVVLTLDPDAVRRRVDGMGARGGELLGRVLDVELVLPAPPRLVLAKVIAGGLVRLGERLGRDLDPLLPLFDPEHDGGAPGLRHVRTVRDAKRAVNALSANLPLWPAGTESDAAIALLDRLLAR
jgi:hypothetical protein